MHEVQAALARQEAVSRAEDNNLEVTKIANRMSKLPSGCQCFILKLLKSLVRNPSETKFQRINTGGKTFKTEAREFQEDVKAILVLIGFGLDDDSTHMTFSRERLDLAEAVMQQCTGK